MKNFPELFGHILVGGILGFCIRLIFYMVHKTSAIAFDEPAALSFMLAILVGCTISGIIGIVDIKHDNKKKI